MMRKLQNTLYVNSDCYLQLDGENVVAKEDGKVVGRVPLHNLESIVTTGYTGASPALMRACADKNIDLCYMIFIMFIIRFFSQLILKNSPEKIIGGICCYFKFSLTNSCKPSLTLISRGGVPLSLFSIFNSSYLKNPIV